MNSNSIRRNHSSNISRRLCVLILFMKKIRSKKKILIRFSGPTFRTKLKTGSELCSGQRVPLRMNPTSLEKSRDAEIRSNSASEEIIKGSQYAYVLLYILVVQRSRSGVCCRRRRRICAVLDFCSNFSLFLYSRICQYLAVSIFQLHTFPLPTLHPSRCSVCSQDILFFSRMRESSPKRSQSHIFHYCVCVFLSTFRDEYYYISLLHIGGTFRCILMVCLFTINQ